MSQFLPPSTDVFAEEFQVAIFTSELGWVGIVGRHKAVSALTFGHSSPGEVHERLLADGVISRFTSPVDWWPELRERLQSYATGSNEEFADIVTAEEHSTPFQQQVVTALRGVGYGETLSYAELASRAGSPKAARAVGRVMATNRIPLLIPCHRVIASGGRLGGYSAPSGLDMKRQLLALEGAQIPSLRCAAN